MAVNLALVAGGLPVGRHVIAPSRRVVTRLAEPLRDAHGEARSATAVAPRLRVPSPVRSICGRVKQWAVDADSNHFAQSTSKHYRFAPL